MRVSCVTRRVPGPDLDEPVTRGVVGGQTDAMELLERVRAQLPGAVEKRMFGGTGFMVDGALACSVSARGLLVRVGAEHQGDLLATRGVEPMVKGGRTSRGWVHVDPRLVTDHASLREWLDRGVAAARASLSPGP
jgi:TfoX/Sxy family transcriptional regulator of competence genes